MRAATVFAAVGMLAVSCAEPATSQPEHSSVAIAQTALDPWMPLSGEPILIESTNADAAVAKGLLTHLKSPARVKGNKITLVAIPKYEHDESDQHDSTMGFMHFSGSEVSDIIINNQRASVDELERYVAQRLTGLQGKNATMANARKRKVDELRSRLAGTIRSVEFDAAKLDSQVDTGGAITFEVADEDLDTLLTKTVGLFDAIDMYHEPEPEDLAGAMRATNAHVIASANYGWEDASIFMTDGGCPEPNAFTRYRRLSGTHSDHSHLVAGIIRGISGATLLCNSFTATGRSLPTSLELAGLISMRPFQQVPPVRVVTMSMGYTSDVTKYSIQDMEWDNFAYDFSNVLLFKSAGNRGADDGWVTAPGKAFNAVTVGSYNHRNMTLADTSSYRNMPTKKPEILAPGVEITAAGLTDSGTSFAAPHAASITAALMHHYGITREFSVLTKALLLAGARTSIKNNTALMAVGGVDYVQSHQGAHIFAGWHVSPGATWWTFDLNDPVPGNGRLDMTFNIVTSLAYDVRVVLAWLNRGTYIYEHRNDANPIGKDFDLCVYGPNGGLIACSTSSTNPFEIVDFRPTAFGTHRIAIHRYANGDGVARNELGVWVTQRDSRQY